MSVRPSVGESVRLSLGGQRLDGERRMVVYTNLFIWLLVCPFLFLFLFLLLKIKAAIFLLPTIILLQKCPKGSQETIPYMRISLIRGTRTMRFECIFTFF